MSTMHASTTRILDSEDPKNLGDLVLKLLIEDLDKQISLREDLSDEAVGVLADEIHKVAERVVRRRLMAEPNTDVFFRLLMGPMLEEARAELSALVGAAE